MAWVVDGALATDTGEVRSNDCASWRDLDCSDSASVHNEKPTAVLASEGTAVGGERGDDVVDHASIVNGLLMLECDVHMIATDELHAKHDSCHANQNRPGR
jgi:hypothetical protein